MALGMTEDATTREEERREAKRMATADVRCTKEQPPSPEARLQGERALRVEERAPGAARPQGTRVPLPGSPLPQVPVVEGAAAEAEEAAEAARTDASCVCASWRLPSTKSHVGARDTRDSEKTLAVARFSVKQSYKTGASAAAAAAAGCAAAAVRVKGSTKVATAGGILTRQSRIISSCRRLQRKSSENSYCRCRA